MTFETVIWVYIGGVIFGAAVAAFGQGAGFWDVAKERPDRAGNLCGDLAFCIVFWPIVVAAAVFGWLVYVPLWLCMKLGEYAARRDSQ